MTVQRKMSLLSIAGYKSGEFNKFVKTLTFDEAGLPAGSVGCSFDFGRDLRELSRLCGDPALFYNALRQAGLSHASIKMLTTWFAFCEGSQPYFFIHKGYEVKWLCKKTSGYFFHERKDGEPILEHRVNFVAVAEADDLRVPSLPTIQSVPYDISMLP